MNKKDKDIEKLLFGLAESNKPDLKVTVPAKIKLSEKRRKKRVFNYYKLAKYAAVFVCAVLIVTLSVQFLSNKITKNGSDSANQQPIQEQINYYYPKDIYVEKTSYENTLTYAPWLEKADEKSDYELYRYCSKKDDTVLMYYISGKFFTNGVYVELKLYIEITKDVYSKLKDMENISKYNFINDIKVQNTTAYIDGEYMSNAYFTDNKIKYYLDVMSASDEGLFKLLEIIV